MVLLVFALVVWASVALAVQNFAIAAVFALATAIALWLFQTRLELTCRQVWFLITCQIVAVLRTQLPLLNIQLPNGFTWLRDRSRELCRGISKDAQALVLGITNGDDSQLSPQLTQVMRDLSLSHLTAVSGTNCSILIAAVFGASAAMGFKTRARVIACLVVLALYLALVGDQPSVYRAAAMASFALLAMLTSSRLNPVATLGLSVIVILLIDHSLASDYSFALSAAATAGLLILAPKLFEKLKTKMPNWLALSLAVTISAQVFCLPIISTLQPEQSSLALVANVLVEPVVALITLLGIFATVMIPISAPIAGLSFFVASIPAQYVAATAQFLAGLSFPAVQVGNLGIWLAIAVVLIVLALKIPSYKPLATFAFSVLAIAALTLQFAQNVTSNFPIRNWFYVSCDVGQGDATVIKSGSAIAVVDVGREPKLIDRCLTRLGISQIDLLVLTHFDADHVAGLSGAIDGRRVLQALVTSYQDDRPGADWIQLQLAGANIPFQRAERGDSGALGEFSWRVLSPHHNGVDSEDPNDGSVTMLWQSQLVNIVTLADLGEKGQMRLGEELASWDNQQLHSNPTVVKVSHHGSADQFPELYEWLKPTIATISDGKNNSYGHPTQFTLKFLREAARVTLRTDQLGSLAIAADGAGGLLYSSG